ncbi:unnamed protein product, partial [Pylaiella littoralis]
QRIKGSRDSPVTEDRPFVHPGLGTTASGEVRGIPGNIHHQRIKGSRDSPATEERA